MTIFVVPSTAFVRAPFQYHGAKSTLAPEIIARFPSHLVYVEPFAGSAVVLLQKPPSYLEVYNDLNSDVVNFFRTLREQPDELIRLIKLTPYSHEECLLAQDNIRHGVELPPLERAREFYVAAGQTISGVRRYRSGWNRDTHANPQARCTPKVDTWQNVEHLYAVAARIRQVQIEHEDVFTVLSRYDAADALFYLDPPYLLGTRAHGKHYLEEAGGKTRQSELEFHKHLSDALHSLRGMALLSGYASPEYAEWFSDWRCDMFAIQDRSHRQRIECLWISPNAQAHQIQKNMFTG